MNKSVLLLRVIANLGVLILTAKLPAADFVWTGSGANLLWATPGNWSPSGPPAAGDSARFFDLGATNDLSLVTVMIGANTSVNSLWVGQTNGLHNFFINPGVTLTVSGTNDNGYGALGSDPVATAPNPAVQSTYYVGTKTESSLTQTVTNTVGGDGTLVLNNPRNELNIRQAWGGGGGAHRAVLDLSGLATFNASLGRIRIGDGEAGAIRRVEAQLWLAKTNTITLTGTNLQENVQLLIGNNDVNNNGNGTVSYLYLGQQTTLNVDEILVGARKQQGNISFNPNLGSPSLKLRASDGVSRVRALRIGDQSNQSASGNPTTGTVNLGSGNVDILADRVIVATSQSSAGSAGTGTLTLGPGTLDAESIELATQLADNVTVAIVGNLNVNGTAVSANQLLRLGRSAAGSGAITANLNVNGGSVMVRSNLVTQGTASINITNGTLALARPVAVLASIVNLDSATISNAASLRVTNTLNLANGAAILGNPVFDMGSSGLANWNVEGAAGNGLIVSNTFQGSGNYSGNLVQAAGATLIPGGNNTVGTLAVQTAGLGGNLTLNNNGTLRFDLSNSGQSGNDQITVSGTFVANGTNNVILTSLGGAFDTANPYTLITAGTLVGTQDNFRIAGPLAQSRYTFTFDTTSTPNSLKLTVGGSGPSTLTWVGDGGANVWDAKGAANWSGGSQFFSLDSVTFNDTGSAAPSIALAGSLIPGSITVNNSTKDYTFSGTGGVAAGGGLAKSGAGALTLNNTADNSFSGLVAISNGAVTFSNTGTNSFAGGLSISGGNLAFSGSGTLNVAAATTIAIGTGTSLTVANSGANNFNDAAIQLDGTLTVNQTVDDSLNGVISGSGVLTKSGSGTLTLGANNAGLSSIIQVNGGTLRGGLAGSLGVGGVTIASGGKLNVNGFSFSTLPVTANGIGGDGKGAIVNQAAPQANALGTVTLAGNTSFGGSGPWNTDPVLNAGMWAITAGLSTSGQAYSLTKTGLNEVRIVGAAVDPALGDIDVQQGLLSFNGATDSMGNPARTLTVRAGATLGLFDTTVSWDKRILLFGDGNAPSIFNYQGTHTLVGPITLNGNCVVADAPPDRGDAASLTFNGTLSGTGGLTRAGVISDVTFTSVPLVLSGTNTYTGDTVISSGTLALMGDGSISASSNVTVAAGAILDASQRADGTLTLASGQTLRGNGTVNGILIAATGSSVAPGTSIGSLSITGAVTLRGMVAMELNAATGTNDVISDQTSIALNGAIISVTNLAGTLSNGMAFKLFDAPAGQISGTFTMQPAAPGPGQTWDTSALTSSGILKVVGNPTSGGSAPQITSVRLTGGNIEVSGSGGTPNGNYTVLTNGDVAQAAANWGSIFTRQFNATGGFSFTNTHSASTPQLYYRVRVP